MGSAPQPVSPTQGRICSHSRTQQTLLYLSTTAQPKSRQGLLLMQQPLRLHTPLSVPNASSCSTSLADWVANQARRSLNKQMHSFYESTGTVGGICLCCTLPMACLATMRPKQILSSGANAAANGKYLLRYGCSWNLARRAKGLQACRFRCLRGCGIPTHEQRRGSTVSLGHIEQRRVHKSSEVGIQRPARCPGTSVSGEHSHQCAWQPQC